METIIFEDKKYIKSNKFTDGGVCMSKDGKTIIRLNGVLGRENWIPLEPAQTKEEIKAAVEKLQISIWSNPKRPSNTQVDECEHCGRKVGKNPLYVHIMTSGIIVPNGITEDDIEKIDEQSQGCFPLGNGCAKKLFGKEVDNYTFRYE